MLKMTLLLLFFSVSQTAAAQTFKVLRLQGKKAIVEINDPSLVSLNEVYSVGQSYGAPSSFKRDYAIDASFGYINQSSPSSSQLSLSGSFLWNMKQYEFGPTLQIVNTSSSGFNTSSTAFGGIGYYNFNENRVGTEHILSVVGQLTQSSGSGSSTTTLSAGGNYRWFVLSGDHCFSFSGVYRTVQSSGSSVAGFVLSGGIATYF